MACSVGALVLFHEFVDFRQPYVLVIAQRIVCRNDFQYHAPSAYGYDTSQIKYVHRVKAYKLATKIMALHQRMFGPYVSS